MAYGMQDLDILVDMGPEETIVEDGNKQTFVRQGGTGSVYMLYENNAGEYDPQIAIGTTTITIPDYSNTLDCTYAEIYIDKVNGEKFTAYRDGIDVTGEFTNTGTQYRYDFDKSEAGRAKSQWTILFEKDENVITGYDWIVIAQNAPEGSKLTIVNGNVADEHLLAEGVNDIHLVASGLQSARFEIPAVEGFNIMISRDGEEMGSAMTLADGVYTLIVPDLEILDAAWFVSMQAVGPYSGSGSLQKIIRHGGKSVVSYEYEGVDCTAYYGDVNEGEPVQYILPPLGDDCASYYFISIELLDGETFKAYRNGVDYTDLFLEGRYDENKKATYYTFNDFDWKNTEIWSTLRDEATWEIVLEEPVIEFTFAGNFKTIYCTTDIGGEIDEPYEGYELEANNVEGVYKGQLIENAIYSGLNASIQFRLNDEKESFRVFRNGVEMTGQFVKYNNITGMYHLQSNADFMHEPAQWLIVTESELARFDMNNDGKVDISDVTKLVNKVLNK